jgi:hypothetical protein
MARPMLADRVLRRRMFHSLLRVLPAVGLTASPAVRADGQQRGGAAPSTQVVLALEWLDDRGAQCPTRDQFVAAAEYVAGQRLFGLPSEAAVVLSVGFRRDPSGRYRATLHLEAPDGQALGNRELESDAPTCDELGRAAALAAVLAADSLTVDAQGPAAVRRKLRVSGSLDLANHGWRGEMGPVTLASWGRLPGTAIGIGLLAAVTPYGRWVTEGAFSVWVPQQTDPQPSVAKLSGWRASSDECLQLGRRAPFELRLCVGAELDQIRGDALGLIHAQSPVSTWMGVFAKGSVLYAVGTHLAFRVDVDGVLPFERDYFYYEGQGGQAVVAFRPAPVDADVSVGVSVRIP